MTSNNGFTCGFDTAAVTYAPDVLEVVYCVAVPAILSVLYVHANAATSTTKVLAVNSSPLIPKVAVVPEFLMLLPNRVNSMIFLVSSNLT